ncbi:MAG TPA: helix-turn-helix domain-containing protein [Actinomycetes bacterium]
MSANRTSRNRFASLAEAADQARVSPRTVRRWVAAGLLPAYRLGPRVLRVDLDDLDALARRIPTAGGR